MSYFLSLLGLPLLSGVLVGTSYIPFPPWAMFFCYVPLWLFALRAKKLSFLLTGGFLCQSVITLIGFNWVFYAVREMGFYFLPACLVFLVFVLIANLHIPLSLALWCFVTNPKGFKFEKLGRKLHFTNHKGFKRAFLLPVLLGLCTEYYPMIFEWHLGYTFFYAKWPIFQTAEIWGFKFLNTFILFSNLVFLYLYLLFRKKQTKRFKLFLCWCICFAGLNVYGWYLKNRLPEPDLKIQALIIQPAVENDHQDKKELRNFILSKILQETSKHFYPPRAGHLPEKSKPAGSKPVDFILWPEGAYPYPVNYLQAQKSLDKIQKWPRVFGAPLIVSAKGKYTQGLSAKLGELSSESAPKAKTGYTNSIFVFDKTGKLTSPPYNKTRLLPFGEYMPGGKWFAFLNRWRFGEERAFKKGISSYKVISLNIKQTSKEEQKPLSAGKFDGVLSKPPLQLASRKRSINLGFQICYEGLFDYITRKSVRQGADLLINVSNDAWFGTWQEPYQHLYMTLSRAVEARRPLIRGTNSGLSAVVSAKGEISGPFPASRWGKAKEVFFHSRENKASSFFMSYGYYINPLFLWLCLILIHLPLFKLRKISSGLYNT